jgi:hypothetical protein
MLRQNRAANIKRAVGEISVRVDRWTVMESGRGRIFILNSGERTPLACGFRRRAENFVPQTFLRRPNDLI